MKILHSIVQAVVKTTTKASVTERPEIRSTRVTKKPLNPLTPTVAIRVQL